MQFGGLICRFNPEVTECDKAGVRIIINDDKNPIPFETVNENILPPMPDSATLIVRRIMHHVLLCSLSSRVALLSV